MAGALVTGAHWYMLLRLIEQPAWPEVVSSAATAVLMALAATLIVQPIVERTGPPGRARRALAFVSYAWMGVAFYAILLLGLADLLQLAVGSFPPSARSSCTLPIAMLPRLASVDAPMTTVNTPE